MAQYTTYNPVTGIPFSWGSGDNPLVEPGHEVIEGIYPADSWRIVDGVPVPHAPDQETLEEIIRSSLQELNGIAGFVRSKYITISPGMEMHYLEKRDQAQKCSVDLLATEEKYPLLASEIGITAPTLQGVAQVVLQRYQLFIFVESKLNKARMRASSDIQNTTTREGARQALDTFQQSLQTEGLI